MNPSRTLPGIPVPPLWFLSDATRQAVLADFNGANYHELALKYGLCFLDVYSITQAAHNADRKAGFLKAVNAVLAVPAWHQSLPACQLDALIRRAHELGETDAARRLQQLYSDSRQSCGDAPGHPDMAPILLRTLTIPEFQAVLQALVWVCRRIQSFIGSFYKNVRSSS